MIRWQVWVAQQVLARNRDRGLRTRDTADPPIIIMDKGDQTYSMAHEVAWPGGRITHHAPSGGVFLEIDGSDQVTFDRRRDGIDPDATRRTTP